MAFEAERLWSRSKHTKLVTNLLRPANEVVDVIKVDVHRER